MRMRILTADDDCGWAFRMRTNKELHYKYIFCFPRGCGSSMNCPLVYKFSSANNELWGIIAFNFCLFSQQIFVKRKRIDADKPNWQSRFNKTTLICETGVKESTWLEFVISQMFRVRMGDFIKKHLWGKIYNYENNEAKGNSLIWILGSATKTLFQFITWKLDRICLRKPKAQGQWISLNGETPTFSLRGRYILCFYILY